MRPRRLALLCIAVALAPVESALAVTKIYTGPQAGSWFVGGNWVPAGVPSAQDDVIIVPGSTVHLPGSATWAQCASLQVLGTLRQVGPGDLFSLGALTVAQGGLIDVQQGGVQGKTVVVDGTVTMTPYQNGTCIFGGGVDGTVVISPGAEMHLDGVGIGHGITGVVIDNYGSIDSTTGSIGVGDQFNNYGSFTVSPTLKNPVDEVRDAASAESGSAQAVRTAPSSGGCAACDLRQLIMDSA